MDVCLLDPVLAYRRVGRYVLAACRGVDCVVYEEAGPDLAVPAGGGVECTVYKRPIDAPYPPLPGPGGSRLLACGNGVVVLTTLEELPPLPPRADPAFLLTAIYKVGRHAFRDLEAMPHLPRHRFPGKGKLTGEEFRIMEPDNDYLRLVGRGGDEYLAWDFVLGTLDTGEWVLLGEDGLYLARRDGERVVVEGAYNGSVFDVRGPPYAPFYPVVPVKWIKERVGKARGEIYAPPVDAEVLLKWPLRDVRWEFSVACVEKRQRPCVRVMCLDPEMEGCAP